jgi:glycosyltransferase involved in cell wall biosynthesis
VSERRAILLAHFAGYLLQFRTPLIEELVARGYRTTVAVPNPDGYLRKGVEKLGADCISIELSRTGLNPLSDARFAWQARRLMQRLRPDLVIATGIKPILYGVPAARHAGASIRVPLLAGLGATIRPASAAQRLLALMVRPAFSRALRSSTHVVTQNVDDTHLLVERFGRDIALSPITTAGSGVDLCHFPAVPPAPEPSVLMMARIVAEKGVWEYLEAARAIRGRRPQVRFVLAGFLESSARGIGQAEFDAGCHSCGVQYVGHVDDIRPLMAACSVFVLPTYYGEGRPRSIQEALAMGRPVITTDNVGCRDAIENGVHGRIIPVRDAVALASAIEDVLDRGDPAAVSTACRQYAERRYGARAIARGWLDEVGA